jgi:hypothetical protein
MTDITTVCQTVVDGTWKSDHTDLVSDQRLKTCATAPQDECEDERVPKLWYWLKIGVVFGFSDVSVADSQ